MWNHAVITDAGKTVLASAAAGNKLIFDYGASGSGTVNADALAACTDVSTRQRTLTITKASSKGSGVTVEVMLTASETAYQARQIGVFAHTGSGSPVLVAIYQDETGIEVPSASEMADFAFVFYATIQVSNASSVEVTVDPSALVTQSQLAEAVSAAVQQLTVQAVSVTLDKNGWNNLTQSVEVSGMTASRKFAASPDTNSWITAQEANLFPPKAGQGTLTFQCEDTPTDDIVVTVYLFG